MEKCGLPSDGGGLQGEVGGRGDEAAFDQTADPFTGIVLRDRRRGQLQQ